MNVAFMIALLWAPAQNPPLVTVWKGELPILIGAPHGGTQSIPDCPERTKKDTPRFVTVTDTRTNLLALELAKAVELSFGKKPHLVIADFSRKFCDANRSAAQAYESESARSHYDAYHRAMREAVTRIRDDFGGGILLDLHGQALTKDVWYRGTQNLKTVKGIYEKFGLEAIMGPDSILGYAESQGFKLKPAGLQREKEEASFNGGFIVQTYGSHRPDGIDAIQIEMGGDSRATAKIPSTVKILAEGLKRFSDRYLKATINRLRRSD